MSGQDSNPAEPLVEPLTRREREILALLAQGHSAPEIAEKLTLALSSVKWHIQQLYGKLGVNGKRQAVSRARELGLLETLPTARPFEPPPTPAGVIGSTSSQAVPSPSVRPSRKDNLPLQVTRFFGRELEIAQLKDRLAEHRLVTLTGSGGVGKTRLSLRAAEEVLADFLDGVWLVELAPLADPALVAQQVASSLGLRDEPGRPILEALTHFLRDRQVLLVLDNCEHLLEACARLAEALLRACPRLRILASSREPVGIAGEAVFSVPSLSFPDPNHLAPIDELNDYTAVSLFIDRARLVLPDYQVSPHNAAALARICQRLDGIPLALEMAAARLNIITAEQLADRLDDAFRVLTGGNRTALPRQQTLRATMDWSYELLSERERLLFQRLSVFAGGCTLEAAEAVCADLRGDVFEASQVLDVLASLVAKSMVIADRRPEDEPRYCLLEITRQYAREKLQDAGDSERLHRRHATYYYYLALAEAGVSTGFGSIPPAWIDPLEAEHDNLRAAQTWSRSVLDGAALGLRLAEAGVSTGFGPISPAWLDRLETEHDNLRAAMAWSLSAVGSAVLGMRLTLAMGKFWYARGYGFEERAWLEGALAHADAERVEDKQARACLLRSLGFLLATRGDLTAGQAQWERSLKLFQELGDRQAIGFVINRVGWLACEQGDAATARLRLEESLALCRELGDEAGIAWGLVTLAMVAIMQEDAAWATALLEEGLNLFRLQQTRDGIAWALNGLGHVAQLRGEYDRATRLHEESLALFQELVGAEIGPDARVAESVAESYHSLGETALAQGDAALAMAHFRKALKWFGDKGYRLRVPWCLAGLAGAVVDEDPERAAWLWGAAEALRLSIGTRQAPAARATRERLMAAAREQLGEEAFVAAWAEGQRMTMEQAVALALDEGE